MDDSSKKDASKNDTSKDAVKKNAVDEDAAKKDANEKEQEAGSRDGWWLQLEEHVYDPHPTVALVGRGVWTLPGKKEAIYINPSKNSCTFCPGRTKRTWCSHLVSAGLREGTIYRGQVYRLPLAKCLKTQQPTKGRSGTKAPRKFDFKPPPATVQEVHKLHAEEGGEGQEVEGADQLPDPKCSPPALPVIHVTPSTPTV